MKIYNLRWLTLATGKDRFFAQGVGGFCFEDENMYFLDENGIRKELKSESDRITDQRNQISIKDCSQKIIEALLFEYEETQLNTLLTTKPPEREYINRTQERTEDNRLVKYIDSQGVTKEKTINPMVSAEQGMELFTLADNCGQEEAVKKSIGMKVPCSDRGTARTRLAPGIYCNKDTMPKIEYVDDYTHWAANIVEIDATNSGKKLKLICSEPPHVYREDHAIDQSSKCYYETLLKNNCGFAISVANQNGKDGEPKTYGGFLNPKEEISLGGYKIECVSETEVDATIDGDDQITIGDDWQEVSNVEIRPKFTQKTMKVKSGGVERRFKHSIANYECVKTPMTGAVKSSRAVETALMIIKENYPQIINEDFCVAINCAQGKDRTGTTAVVLAACVDYFRALQDKNQEIIEKFQGKPTDEYINFCKGLQGMKGQRLEEKLRTIDQSEENDKGIGFIFNHYLRYIQSQSLSDLGSLGFFDRMDLAETLVKRVGVLHEKPSSQTQTTPPQRTTVKDSTSQSSWIKISKDSAKELLSLIQENCEFQGYKVTREGEGQEAFLRLKNTQEEFRIMLDDSVYPIGLGNSQPTIERAGEEYQQIANRIIQEVKEEAASVSTTSPQQGLTPEKFRETLLSNFYPEIKTSNGYKFIVQDSGNVTCAKGEKQQEPFIEGQNWVKDQRFPRFAKTTLEKETHLRKDLSITKGKLESFIEFAKTLELQTPQELQALAMIAPNIESPKNKITAVNTITAILEKTQAQEITEAFHSKNYKKLASKYKAKQAQASQAPQTTTPQQTESLTDNLFTSPQQTPSQTQATSNSTTSPQEAPRQTQPTPTNQHTPQQAPQTPQDTQQKTLEALEKKATLILLQKCPAALFDESCGFAFGGYILRSQNDKIVLETESKKEVYNLNLGRKSKITQEKLQKIEKALNTVTKEVTPKATFPEKTREEFARFVNKECEGAVKDVTYDEEELPKVTIQSLKKGDITYTKTIKHPKTEEEKEEVSYKIEISRDSKIKEIKIIGEAGFKSIMGEGSLLQSVGRRDYRSEKVKLGLAMDICSTFPLSSRQFIDFAKYHLKDKEYFEKEGVTIKKEGGDYCISSKGENHAIKEVKINEKDGSLSCLYKDKMGRFVDKEGKEVLREDLCKKMKHREHIEGILEIAKKKVGDIEYENFTTQTPSQTQTTSTQQEEPTFDQLSSSTPPEPTKTPLKISQDLLRKLKNLNLDDEEYDLPKQCSIAKTADEGFCLSDGHVQNVITDQHGNLTYLGSKEAGILDAETAQDYIDFMSSKIQSALTPKISQQLQSQIATMGKPSGYQPIGSLQVTALEHDLFFFKNKNADLGLTIRKTGEVTGYTHQGQTIAISDLKTKTELESARKIIKEIESKTQETPTQTTTPQQPLPPITDHRDATLQHYKNFVEKNPNLSIQLPSAGKTETIIFTTNENDLQWQVQRKDQAWQNLTEEMLNSIKATIFLAAEEIIKQTMQNPSQTQIIEKLSTEMSTGKPPRSTAPTNHVKLTGGIGLGQESSSWQQPITP